MKALAEVRKWDSQPRLHKFVVTYRQGGKRQVRYFKSEKLAKLSLELGMFDDAAMVLEEIAPEDKTRNEVLGARVGIYMAARKWDMAAAVASHLVKVEPENAGWWISLAYSVRRIEGIEKAEAILLRAQAIHPKVAMIAFSLACYASFTGRMEEAKVRLQHAITLDKDIRGLAIDDEDLRPLWDWIAGLK